MAPFRRYHDLFVGMIAAGVSEGSLVATDPQVAARAIVSLSVGMLLQSVLDPDGTDWAQAADDGVRLLLTGLLRRDA